MSEPLELKGTYPPKTSDGNNTEIDWQALQKGLQKSQNSRSPNIYGASGDWDKKGLEAYKKRCQSQQNSGSANRGSSCGR